MAQEAVQLPPVRGLCLSILKNSSKLVFRTSAAWEGKRLSAVFSLKENPLSITHIGQHHWVPFNEQLENADVIAEDVFKSQWRIIELLRAERPDAIFLEGSEHLSPAYRDFIRTISVNMSAEALEQLNNVTGVAVEFLKMFPQGLPRHADRLTKAQKVVIARLGGAEALWISKEIDSVYGAEDKKLNADAYEQMVVPLLQSLAELENSQRLSLWQYSKQSLIIANVLLSIKISNRYREVAALQRAASLARQRKQGSTARVFLIYGNAHNFEAYNSPYLEIDKRDLTRD